MSTRTEIMVEVTNQFLQELQPDDDSVQNFHVILGQLLRRVNEKFAENGMCALLHLSTVIIVPLFVKLLPLVSIRVDENAYVLGLYREDGKKKGIYDCSIRSIASYLRNLCRSHVLPAENTLAREIIKIAPQKELCRNKNLIPVNNGIFDCTTKTLLPFSPDYVFTAKCRVDYREDAHNVLIHNSKDNTEWDVEQWLASLVNRKKDISEIWQVLCNIIRPCDEQHHSAWLYVADDLIDLKLRVLCRFMQNFCSCYCSDSLRSFKNPRYAEDMVSNIAWIGYTRWAGQPIDTFARVKDMLYGKKIPVMSSFKSKRMKLSFRYFFVQFLNEAPRIADTSEKIWKYQMFISLINTDISRDEYDFLMEECVGNQEVLEYVLHKVLHRIADVNEPV